MLKHIMIEPITWKLKTRLVNNIEKSVSIAWIDESTWYSYWHFWEKGDKMGVHINSEVAGKGTYLYCLFHLFKYL